MAVDKPRNSGQWTEARYNSFVKSALRGARWPAKYDALRLAAVGKKVNVLTGRIAMHFKCASCKKDFPNKLVCVDHTLPVIDPNVGFLDWNEYIARLYVEVGELQVLCKPCHDNKTNQEKAIATARRKIV